MGVLNLPVGVLNLPGLRRSGASRNPGIYGCPKLALIHGCPELAYYERVFSTEIIYGNYKRD